MAAQQQQQVAVKNHDNFLSYLTANKDLIKNQIQMALPKHMNAERMLRILMTEMRRNPELNKCTTQSVLGSIMHASQLGLEIGALLGQGYLVPYNRCIDKQSKRYAKECQFIIGYRGMIELARRSGNITSLIAHAIFENDFFEFQYGLNEKLNHVPVPTNRGNFIGAYAYATITGGGHAFGVMFKDEIEMVRKFSKTANAGPWVNHYEEMGKKTIVRRLFKFLPISTEIYENIVREELQEINDSPLPLEDGLIEGLDNSLIEHKKQTKSDALSNKMKKNTEVTESINNNIQKEEVSEMAKEYFNEN
jgi:recombination protein RecT